MSIASFPLTSMHTTTSLHISWCQGMLDLLTVGWILLSVSSLRQSDCLHIKQFSPFSTLKRNSWSDCKAGRVRPTHWQAEQGSRHMTSAMCPRCGVTLADSGLRLSWTHPALRASSAGLISERQPTLFTLNSSFWCYSDNKLKPCTYME